MKEYKVVTGGMFPQSFGFLGIGATQSGQVLFEEEVNALLASGWECQGGICIASTDQGQGAAVFLQALVRDVSE